MGGESSLEDLRFFFGKLGWTLRLASELRGGLVADLRERRCSFPDGENAIGVAGERRLLFRGPEVVTSSDRCDLNLLGSVRAGVVFDPVGGASGLVFLLSLDAFGVVGVSGSSTPFGFLLSNDALGVVGVDMVISSYILTMC